MNIHYSFFFSVLFFGGSLVVAENLDPNASNLAEFTGKENIMAVETLMDVDKMDDFDLEDNSYSDSEDDLDMSML